MDLSIGLEEAADAEVKAAARRPMSPARRTGDPRAREQDADFHVPVTVQPHAGGTLTIDGDQRGMVRGT